MPAKKKESKGKREGAESEGPQNVKEEGAADSKSEGTAEGKTEGTVCKDEPERNLKVPQRHSLRHG